MAEKTIQLITRRQTDLNSRLSNFVLRPDDKYCEMTATTGNAMVIGTAGGSQGAIWISPSLRHGVFDRTAHFPRHQDSIWCANRIQGTDKPYRFVSVLFRVSTYLNRPVNFHGLSRNPRPFLAFPLSVCGHQLFEWHDVVLLPASRTFRTTSSVWSRPMELRARVQYQNPKYM